jgi:hypothetical protein
VKKSVVNQGGYAVNKTKKSSHHLFNEQLGEEFIRGVHHAKITTALFQYALRRVYLYQGSGLTLLGR